MDHLAPIRLLPLLLLLWFTAPQPRVTGLLTPSNRMQEPAAVVLSAWYGCS